jgi:very-short-patch-repair endonuclease
MGYPSDHSPARRAWALARRQHDVIAHFQLVELGFHAQAIKHRIARGRLYALWRGVYAVGRPTVTQLGLWMAAVLACGPTAVLSHGSAAALWGMIDATAGDIHVSLMCASPRRHRGIRAHRRRALSPGDSTEHKGIRVTTPVATLIDLASRASRGELERAINKADELDLIDPEALRVAIREANRRPGLAVLRRVLDRRTFRLTRSELERRFLPLARAAGLPEPQTLARVNGFEVDFYWPELRLVVETDGLRYHRTPAQQARDRLRDQAHTAAGLTPLRFTHAQVAYEQAHVRRVLTAVTRRLRPRRSLE